MRAYNVGDKVLFHIDVIHVNPVEGEIVEIGGNGMYVVQHKGLKCGVQEKFIVSKIVPPEELISQLEERILEDDKKLQNFTKQVISLEAAVVRLKERIAKQQNEIDELRRDAKKSWKGIFDDDDFIRKIPRRSPRWTIPVDKKLTCCKSSYNLEH